MHEFFATYGWPALSWGLTALVGVAIKYGVDKVKSQAVRGLLDRALHEVAGAVREVAQTYADAVKAASADGKLTEAERSAAKAQAIQIAKMNLGVKGLERLVRVLGLDDVDKWLGTHTEALLLESKKK